MKITKEQLKTIIREELKRSLAESRFAAMDMPRDTTGGVQAGLGQKPKSRLASVEPAAGGFEGVGAPKTRGEARMMARKAGELSYTWEGKKYGTRGSSETPKQWKEKMAAIRARQQYDKEGIGDTPYAQAVEDPEVKGQMSDFMGTGDVEPDKRLVTNRPPEDDDKAVARPDMPHIPVYQEGKITTASLKKYISEILRTDYS